MFACNESQIGMAKLIQGYRLSQSDGHYIQTKAEGKKSIKLKMNELVLQVFRLNTRTCRKFHYLRKERVNTCRAIQKS